MYDLELKKSEIDSLTAMFKSEFDELDEDQLNISRNDTWSIGQIIDHIVIINSSYFPIFDELKDNSYSASFLSKLRFIPNFFGKFILKGVQPEEKRKTRTFPIWEPSKSSIGADILQTLEKHHDELKRYFDDIKSHISNNVIIHSPANKNVVYPLQTAIDIIITHEKRHFLQAQNLLLQLKEDN